MPPERRRSTDREADELTDVARTLDKSVSNLTAVIAAVKRLEDDSQRLQQAQQNIETTVVFKDAFDAAWAENAGRLVHIGKVNRRLAVTSFAASVLLVGSVLGWFIHEQLGQNNHQDKLTEQRVAACEQKNAAAQRTVDYFGRFIDQEKARAHPDPVIVDILTGVRLQARGSITPCPGATGGPTPSP